MGATGPAAGAADALLQFRTDPLDVLLAGFGFFDGESPADPLVARERGDVFPGPARFGIGGERVAQVCGKSMGDAGGNAKGRHGGSGWRPFRAKRNAKDRRSAARRQCIRSGGRGALEFRRMRRNSYAEPED